MKTAVKNTPKGLNITLWIGQIMLAAMFIMAGLWKTTTPLQELSTSLPLATEVPEALVRFIGISELLGGLGLLLPGILRVKPILTPCAALGLVIIMILAMFYHISKGELAAVGINFALGALASFVAWGRFKKAPIYPKAISKVKNY